MSTHPLDAGTVVEVKCRSAIDAIAAVYRRRPWGSGRLAALAPHLTSPRKREPERAASRTKAATNIIPQIGDHARDTSPFATPFIANRSRRPIQPPGRRPHAQAGPRKVVGLSGAVSGRSIFQERSGCRVRCHWRQWGGNSQAAFGFTTLRVVPLPRSANASQGRPRLRVCSSLIGYCSRPCS